MYQPRWASSSSPGPNAPTVVKMQTQWRLLKPLYLWTQTIVLTTGLETGDTSGLASEYNLTVLANHFWGPAGSCI